MIIFNRISYVRELIMHRKALWAVLFILLLTFCKSGQNDDITNNDLGAGSYISVLLPNGGEELIEGSSYEIKWKGDYSNSVNIRYTTDNGNLWYVLAESIQNSGTYFWNPVPGKISNQCRVKISAFDESISDESNSSFSIIRSREQSLFLLSPEGGENWEAGAKCTILWQSSGIDSVNIYFSSDAGSNWNLIAVDKVNSGSYEWNPVTAEATGKAKIKIADAKDNYPADESSAVFNILPEPKINIISPVGGEIWVAGSDREILWESENVPNVRLEYTVNSGGDWHMITEAAGNAGYYLWTNIPSYNSSICKIRVADSEDGWPSAESSGFFTLKSFADKKILVQFPIGGSSFFQGDSICIKWTSEYIQYVTIEYTYDSGITWLSIADLITADKGEFIWIAPNVVSNKCRIRIKDAQDSSVCDESDALFSIKKPQYINVIYPNGGEVFYMGDSITVQWNSSGIENVKIQFSTEGSGQGRIWRDAVTSAPSVFCCKIVFTEPSNEYLLRISDSSDDSPADESDSVFKVITRNLNKADNRKVHQVKDE